MYKFACVYGCIQIDRHCHGSLQGERKQAGPEIGRTGEKKALCFWSLEKETLWDHPNHKKKALSKAKPNCFLLSTSFLTARSRSELGQLQLGYHNEFDFFLSALVEREKAKTGTEQSQAHRQHSISTCCSYPLPSHSDFIKAQCHMMES